MRVRRIWAVGLLLLVAVLVGLLLDREAAEPGFSTPDDARRERADVALLTAEMTEDREHAGPALETRQAPVEARPQDDAGPVTVKVVGLAGRGMPNVFVGIVPSSRTLGANGRAGPPPEGGVLETDDAGEAVFAHVPYDGSRAVLVYREDPRARGPASYLVYFHADRGPPARLITGPELVYCAATGVWLTVEAVDAETGRRIQGAHVHPQASRMSFPDDVRRRPLKWLLPLPVDTRTTLTLGVTAPPGWVAWESTSWTVQISPYAKHLVARYPLRRDVDVSVSVLEPDRSLLADPRLSGLEVANRALPVRTAATDAYGRLRLAGIPFLPGEIVELMARRPKGSMWGTAKAAIPDDSGRGLHLEIVVPPEPEPGGMIGIGRGAGGYMFRGRAGHRTLMASGGGSPKRPRGRATVRVLRRSGKPAVAAEVTLRSHHGGVRTAFTDATGCARFGSVYPGEYAVSVRQVGLFALHGSLAVTDDREATLVLREGPACQVRVQVVDERGRALPFARLEITTSSKHPWADLREGDVQRVDPFTDHKGCRTLRGMEPGVVRVEASWGSRTGATSTRVDVGTVHGLRIILRRPKAP